MWDIKSVTPPGIALVLAFLLIYWGSSGNNLMLTIAGWVFLGVALFLQLSYLFARYRNRFHATPVPD